jgi:hypothetical protein
MEDITEKIANGAGISSLILQIYQFVRDPSLDWKHAPESVKSFLAELKSFEIVFSMLQSIPEVDQRITEASDGQFLLTLHQTGTDTSRDSHIETMLIDCQKQLEHLMQDLQERSVGNQFGWDRFRAAFEAKAIRDSVSDLLRRSQILCNLVTMNAAAVAARRYEVAKASKHEDTDFISHSASERMAKCECQRHHQRSMQAEHCQICKRVYPPESLGLNPLHEASISGEEGVVMRLLATEGELITSKNVMNEHLYTMLLSAVMQPLSKYCCQLWES